MKKILLLTIILLFQFSTAQMTVKKIDGTMINNGDIISFNSTSITTAKMKFKVYNTSSSPINVKIRCNSITNATGEDMQLCFNVCYLGVVVGNSYPTNAVVIQPNGQNGNDDSFWNSDIGNGTFPMDYNFTFYMVDANGAETGNTVTFTYRYNPNLNTNNFETQKLFDIYPNPTKDILNISGMSAIKSVSVFNVLGQQVHKENNILETSHQMDISKLAQGTYLVKIGAEQASQDIKIIKE